jgi:hypothetical protein
MHDKDINNFRNVISIEIINYYLSTIFYKIKYEQHVHNNDITIHTIHVINCKKKKKKTKTYVELPQ